MELLGLHQECHTWLIHHEAPHLETPSAMRHPSTATGLSLEAGLLTAVPAPTFYPWDSTLQLQVNKASLCTNLSLHTTMVIGETAG